MKLKTVTISKKIAGAALLLLLYISFSRTLDYLALELWKHEMFSPGLAGKTVIIDPGHGGADPGAVAGGLKEADLNMALARALKQELEAKGVKVRFTREGDKGLVPASTMTYSERWLILENRKKYARENKGHILLSLHINSNKDPRASGAMVFYSDEKSRKLALCIQEELNKLGLRKRQAESANFNIVNTNPMPSVLIETGFITNQKDRESLLSNQDGFAAAIGAGLQKYADNLSPNP